MSAAPNLPPDYRDLQEVPPRRPPRWKRFLAWVGGAIILLIITAIVAVLLLLHSGKGHQYVLRVAQEQATAALGSSVRVRDFGLSFSGLSPTLDLYDIVVSGANPHPDPPLITAERLHVAVKVTSLLRRTWYLEDVRLDRPVVRVLVDKNGKDNLPQTKSDNQQQSNTNLFDLGVRHAVLNNGEVYYNNQKSVLDADLHDLTFQANFTTGEKRYSGTLSYRDGHLKMADFRPIPHDLDAQFTATPTAFTLQRAVLRSGQSQFVLVATVQDYDHPKIQAKYDATLDTGEVRNILRNSSVPDGVIRASGRLDYASQPNRPMLDVMVLNGAISSGVLRVQMPSFRGDIRNVAARYTVANGNLDVRDLRASLLGGQLTGTMTIRNLAGAARSQLQANLRGVSLAEVKSQITSPALRELALSGTLDANADATWGKTMSDLVAHADATMNAAVAPANGNATSPVPVNSVIHAVYNAPANEITVNRSYVRTARTSLDLNGTISRRSALAIRLQANDLSELDQIATQFRPGQPVLGLGGTAAFNGSVTGTSSAPRLTGQLTGSNLRVRGTAWKTLRTNVDVSPSGASLQNGELLPAQRGRINFNLRAGLQSWSFTPGSPIDASLKASQLSLEELVRAAGVQTPMSGTLAANLDVHGSQLSPAGQGSITLTNARISDEPIQSVNLKFNGTGDAVQAQLAVRMPAGPTNAVLTYYPRQRGYDAQLQATGIRLGQLETVKQRNLELTGVLNLIASGRGTLDNPALTAKLDIPRLDVRGQTISGLALNAVVANHVANISLDSQVLNTSLRGRGTIKLAGDYFADATLDTQSIPLEPLVAAYAPAQAGNVKGQTELHATLRGPLKNKAALEAHVTIPTLAVNYRDTVQIAAASPIRADYTNGVLQLQRATLRGTGTDLQFQATVPVVTKAPPSVLALGTIDLRLAQMLNPDVTSSGQVRFNINSYGSTNPDVQGQIEVRNATFATGDMPLGLQNGNGVLTMTRDRVNITRFTGTVGGGDVTASGGVVYRPDVQMNLAVKGRGMRMLHSNIRAGFDTDLALTGTPENALLRGDVRLTQLQFTSQFELTDLMSQMGGPTTPPPTGGFTQALKLDVGLQSTSGINTVSRTLSLQAAANLRVVGTAAQPVVLGRVNINGGDLIFMGNRYVLQGGTLDFVNTTQTEPVVNVSVNTTIQQYNIQMHFWGPAEHLHTNYSSDPALPPSDIINLVAFGKTEESAAANPTPPGNLGAQSLLASQVSSQVTSRLSKVAGISQLSVDPLRGCNQQSGGTGACITVQQRVTSKMFVTFSADVTNTQRTTVQLEYRATPRVSFSGSRDQNGGFGFDTRIHKSW